MCTPTQKKLCGKENCKICFDRSFASNEKSKYWDESNDIKPIEVCIGTRKKYKFKCDKCPHVFEANLRGVVNNGWWCPFCAIPSQILCDSKDCDSCFKRSFLSNPKSNFWNESNIVLPRYVFKDKKINFKQLTRFR